MWQFHFWSDLKNCVLESVKTMILFYNEKILLRAFLTKTEWFTADQQKRHNQLLYNIVRAWTKARLLSTLWRRQLTWTFDEQAERK